jgi:hypothetical protein
MTREALQDDALVVRGGSSSAELIRLSAFAVPGGERGIAAVSGNGKSLIELCAFVRHPLVTSSNAGIIRKAGGDVIPATGAGPFAAVIIGIRSPDDCNAVRRVEQLEG